MKGRKTGRHCVSSGWVGSPFTKTFLNSQPIDTPAEARTLVGMSWGLVLKRLCWRVSQG